MILLLANLFDDVSVHNDAGPYLKIIFLIDSRNYFRGYIHGFFPS